jgi:hypothetical protein
MPGLFVASEFGGLAVGGEHYVDAALGGGGGDEVPDVGFDYIGGDEVHLGAQVGCRCG